MCCASNNGECVSTHECVETMSHAHVAKVQMDMQRVVFARLRLLDTCHGQPQHNSWLMLARPCLTTSSKASTTKRFASVSLPCRSLSCLIQTSSCLIFSCPLRTRPADHSGTSSQGHQAPDPCATLKHRHPRQQMSVLVYSPLFVSLNREEKSKLRSF
jgi:hypothetical protein